MAIVRSSTCIIQQLLVAEHLLEASISGLCRHAANVACKATIKRHDLNQSGPCIICRLMPRRQESSDMTGADRSRQYIDTRAVHPSLFSSSHHVPFAEMRSIVGVDNPFPSNRGRGSCSRHRSTDRDTASVHCPWLCRRRGFHLLQ